jgi:hypothetical protein
MSNGDVLFSKKNEYTLLVGLSTVHKTGDPCVRIGLYEIGHGQTGTSGFYKKYDSFEAGFDVVWNDAFPHEDKSKSERNGYVSFWDKGGVHKEHLRIFTVRHVDPKKKATVLSVLEVAKKITDALLTNTKCKIYAVEQRTVDEYNHNLTNDYNDDTPGIPRSETDNIDFSNDLVFKLVGAT